MDENGSYSGPDTALKMDVSKLGRFTVSRVRRKPDADACEGVAAGAGGCVSGEGDSTASSSPLVPPTVIMLFGWLGAKDKNLAKYAELYHGLGHEAVIRYTAPVLHVFQHWQVQMGRTAKELLRVLDEHFHGTKVFLHYFSSGGCFVHWNLLKVLQKRGLTTVPNLCGVIFDSCPAPPSARTSARALTATLAGMTRKGSYGVVFFCIGFWNTLTANSLEREYMAGLEADPLCVPNLYIYSADDRITDAKVVSQLIQTRRQRAAEKQQQQEERGSSRPLVIEEWVLESSPHVAHYLKYPREYRERVADFTARALAAV